MTFTNGAVPTSVPVHPTPLHQALAAVVITVVLWRLERRLAPLGVFGAYLVLPGVSRFLVDMLRITIRVLGRLTQPQLWAVLGVVFGALLVLRAGARRAEGAADGEPTALTERCRSCGDRGCRLVAALCPGRWSGPGRQGASGVPVPPEHAAPCSGVWGPLAYFVTKAASRGSSVELSCSCRPHAEATTSAGRPARGVTRT